MITNNLDCTIMKELEDQQINEGHHGVDIVEFTKHIK